MLFKNTFYVFPVHFYEQIYMASKIWCHYNKTDWEDNASENYDYFNTNTYQ